MTDTNVSIHIFLKRGLQNVQVLENNYFRQQQYIDYESMNLLIIYIKPAKCVQHWVIITQESELGHAQEMVFRCHWNEISSPKLTEFVSSWSVVGDA